MQDRNLFKTMRGTYVPANWNGKNESGWDPTGAMVLVLPDKAAEKSAGGIIISDQTQELQGMAAEAGTIVAIGPTAFKWADRERTTRWEGKTPQVGDRVCYQRYSGVNVHGDDGETYSTMNDFCIGAVRAGRAAVSDVDADAMARELARADEGAPSRSAGKRANGKH